MIFTNHNLDYASCAIKIIAKNILSCAICGANITFAIYAKEKLTLPFVGENIFVNAYFFLMHQQVPGLNPGYGLFLSQNIPDFLFFTGTSI